MDKHLQNIRKALGRVSIGFKPSLWLDTGVPDLNEVLGDRNRGIPYGRMIEISGWESQGKSAISMALCALAQHGGAHVVWGDVENSFDPPWAIQRGFMKCPECKGIGQIVNPKTKTSKECDVCDGAGLDYSRLTLIQPYVGRFGGEKEPRLSTAQEICTEMEACIKAKRKTDKVVVVVDSIAGLLTEGEGEAGIENSNMRSKMDLPMFMSQLLRRWVGVAQTNNALIVLVNQLRTSPGKKFGDPTYTPGGNAAKFYSHIRVRVRRVQNSKIVNKGKTVGIKGIMKCLKNKTGGVEGNEIGYRIMFKGPLEFVSAKSVQSTGE